MTHLKESFHGSDLEKIEEKYGIRKSDIISFSANVNPLGLSTKLKDALTSHLDAILSYPDRNYKALRKCMADYTGAAVDHIIVGNGSTELISLFIQTIRPANAMLLAPTYSEYEREVSMHGGIVHYFPLLESDNFQLNKDLLYHTILDKKIDMLILCNPNNPTSTSIPNTEMKSILAYCKHHDIYVMIDETYVEFTEEPQSISAVCLTQAFDNLIVLRGISKFFASPGLRLGYAITGSLHLIETIQTHKNPWGINSLAEIAGQALFTDQDYIRSSRAFISTERKRIYEILNKITSIKVYAPTANFILFKLQKNNADAGALFEYLIKKNLMVRDCSSFSFLDNRYIRFCFLQQEQNDQLLDALQSSPFL